MTIIQRPIVTEKMTAAGEKSGRYGFLVDRQANKIEIKKAVEKLYGVTVEEVRTMNCRGKVKSRHTKTGLVTGRKNMRKKAIVTLKKGETIDFFSSI